MVVVQLSLLITGGAIRVRRNRLYASKEETEKAIDNVIMAYG